MPPRPMNQAAVERLIAERVAAAVEAERQRQVNARRQGNNEAGGQGGAPAARECTFSGFMKCNPTVFHGHEGSVELSRWFEKTEMVFGISECTEARKVKFAAATLQGQEFCPVEEVQRMEHELWNLKVKEFDITAYTKRFHELGNARAMTTAPAEQGGYAGNKPLYCKGKAIATGANTRPTVTCYDCGEKGHTRNNCLKKMDPQGEKARGRAYVIRDAEKQQGPNVVTGTFLLKFNFQNFSTRLRVEFENAGLVEISENVVVKMSHISPPYHL
ncbi:putative reverse transcriptase domain-containing protein [Tanacetum coccineum]